MSFSNLANETLSLPAIIGVAFQEHVMEVSLSDGRILSIPLAWYPHLAKATPTQLKKFEISPGGYGIHWPDLDEDLGIKGFLFP